MSEEIRPNFRTRAGRVTRVRLALLAVALALAACGGAHDKLLFDDPVPRPVLEGPLGMAPRGAGTFFWGDVRNEGDAVADNLVIHITAYGPGQVVIGTFSELLGVYDDAEGEVVGLLEPGEQISFAFTAPVAFGRIASTSVSFSFTTQVEED